MEYRVTPAARHKFDEEGVILTAFVKLAEEGKEPSYIFGKSVPWSHWSRWFVFAEESGKIYTFKRIKGGVKFAHNKKIIKKMEAAGIIEPWEFIQVFDEIPEDLPMEVPDIEDEEELKNWWIMVI